MPIGKKSGNLFNDPCITNIELPLPLVETQSAGAVEYTDCISAER